MRYFAWLLVGLCSLPAYALTKVDIYSTQIAVNTEEPNADEIARQQGMLEVLVRASGDASVASNSVVKKALGQSSRYISQLGYTQVDGQQALNMKFNSNQIDVLLQQAELTSWPAERSNIMVWLVEDNGYDRTITWEHSNSAMATQLRAEAKKRGLPLTFPVGDFDDMTGIQSTDLWGGFVSSIGQATMRYPVDAVMVIKADGRQLRWSLYDQSPASMGKTQIAPITGGTSGEQAAQSVIAQVSDYYASKNTSVVSGDSAGTVTVAFNGLANADAFFTLERALGRLASTARVDVAEIRGNNVIVRVALLGSIDSFEQEVLKLGLVKKVEVVEEVAEEVLEAAEPKQLPETSALVSAEETLQTPNEAGANVSDVNVSDGLESSTTDSSAETASDDKTASGLISKPKLVFEWLY
ncbi:DUF2066 domain-containing protein [Vibrio sp. ZSDZ65]|uniref:DUF2066 domain-containing protein n=1 Tax=Vibrio qingdaonensis TaxID=2829491 RepID=A0A9X3CMG2_9VIBR|nr:DUF2066 domain-containing protein [Vibrio qingdaonensis]MCW8346157.1 DUF2066 domain-containing protein [Vibrio qingdaonensis]